MSLSKEACGAGGVGSNARGRGQIPSEDDSDGDDIVLHSDDAPSSAKTDAARRLLKRKASSELVHEAPPSTSSVVTPKKMPKFVGLLRDLKAQNDGYGVNMRRLVSNSTALNTRFHDLIREQRNRTQRQDGIIKELSENIEGLKGIVQMQGSLIEELRQRLEVGTGRGYSIGAKENNAGLP